MSAVALQNTDGGSRGAPAGVDEAKLEKEWRDNLTAAWDYRKLFEPTWLSNLAFGKGQHWLVYDEDHAKMRHLSEIDPRYQDRELVTIDKINEHVQAQLGELKADDDRPELLTAQDGEAAEEVTKELNDLAGHCWDYEWAADSAIRQTDRLCLKLGVSAIWVRSEPTRNVAGYMTRDTNGAPVTDEAALAHLEQHGMLPDGSLPSIDPVYERRTIWEPLSAFNLLIPPGIAHEDALPWECVMRPVLLDDVKARYPAAANWVEDADIGSLIGTTVQQSPRAGTPSAQKGRLRGHVWLFTVFVRPCAKYPDGMKLVLGKTRMELLEAQPQLDYTTPSRERRSGLHYFHWWRNDDTFYSRAMLEPLKDPQRIINRRETQKGEIIDRGMPKTFVKEGTLVHNPAGLPLEVVELKADANEPNFFAGIGPGAWINEDLQQQADNMGHASTLSQLRLGENPPNVMTLGQLALLNENESAKRSLILQERKASIAACLEDGLTDVRRYWPTSKQIMVEGEDGKLTQKLFEKSRIPDFFVCRPAKGSSKPRSQGAELTKVDAIWNAMVASGLAVGPNAEKYVAWYRESLDAGEAVEMPEASTDSQVEMARYENYLMLELGQDVEPADYDLLPSHVPEHRVAQNQARAAGDMAAYARIERHVQASKQLVLQNAAMVAAARQAPAPGVAPGTPPGPPSSLVTGVPHGLSPVTGAPMASPPPAAPGVGDPLALAAAAPAAPPGLAPAAP